LPDGFVFRGRLLNQHSRYAETRESPAQAHHLRPVATFPLLLLAPGFLAKEQMSEGRALVLKVVSIDSTNIDAQRALVATEDVLSDQ
jgi:hypothetical protein